MAIGNAQVRFQTNNWTVDNNQSQQPSQLSNTNAMWFVICVTSHLTIAICRLVLVSRVTSLVMSDEIDVDNRVENSDLIIDEIWWDLGDLGLGSLIIVKGGIHGGNGRLRFDEGESWFIIVLSCNRHHLCLSTKSETRSIGCFVHNFPPVAYLPKTIAKFSSSQSNFNQRIQTIIPLRHLISDLPKTNGMPCHVCCNL